MMTLDSGLLVWTTPVAPTPWGTGGTCPHFYKWLGTGAPWVEEQQTRNSTELYWPSQNRSPKRLIVLIEPKKWRGTSKKLFLALRAGSVPRPTYAPDWCPYFQIRSGATGPPCKSHVLTYADKFIRDNVVAPSWSWSCNCHTAYVVE